MRRKLRRKKIRLINKLHWWLDHDDLLEAAEQQGYQIQHKRFARRYRWWVDYVHMVECTIQPSLHTLKVRHIRRRVFTSGSLNSCLAALKLMIDWRGYVA